MHAPLKDTGTGRRGDAGYSLIEVMVVLMIFSVLASIVGMNLRKPLQTAKFKTVHSDIIEIVELARAEAANRGDLVLFNDVLRAQTREPDDALINFPQFAGAKAYGACLETIGQYELNGTAYNFRVEPVTCRVMFNV